MSKRRSGITEDWLPSEELLAWAKSKHPQVDVALQTEMFVDHFRANGKPMKDWDAAWRNWIRRSQTMFVPKVFTDAPSFRAAMVPSRMTFEPDPEPPCEHSNPICADCRRANARKVTELLGQIGKEISA